MHRKLDGSLNGVLSGALVLVGALAAASPAEAQPEAEETSRIRDNLFLMEEAYNQEPGVVQHIQSFSYSFRSREWLYQFTEEWPVPTDLNQLSVTLPVVGLGQAAGGGAALGDVLVNYRIQAVGLGGASWIALSPRLSLLLPTGDVDAGTSRGAIGLQLNLPLSMELGRYVAVHLNAGLTVTPSARSPAGGPRTALDVNAGLALVVQPLEWFNLLVETVYVMTDDLTGPPGDRFEHALVVDPGVRFAIDVRDVLQIVPGVSAPITVWPGEPADYAILGYLSFEHVVWR